MSTKSLYNIAGFLGAQSRSNPADHGDSWGSHKSAKPQEELPVYQEWTNPLSSLEPLNPKCTDGLIPLRQLRQERSAIIAERPELIPINPRTISVGDTVRLVGSRAINSNWGKDLTIGHNYKVVLVDSDDDEIPIKIADDVNNYIWMYAEDMLQVI